jgi:hypothetical protein
VSCECCGGPLPPRRLTEPLARWQARRHCSKLCRDGALARLLAARGDLEVPPGRLDDVLFLVAAETPLHLIPARVNMTRSALVRWLQRLGYTDLAGRFDAADVIHRDDVAA